MQSELTCLRVLMATVLALTAVIFSTEVWVERRIAVDSYIEPAGSAKKKKVTCSPGTCHTAEGVQIPTQKINSRPFSLSCECCATKCITPSHDLIHDGMAMLGRDA